MGSRDPFTLVREMETQIQIELTATELDFIGTLLMNQQYGTVARANMLHLLGKLQQQANAPKQNGSANQVELPIN